jgi:hypothetical protein
MGLSFIVVAGPRQRNHSGFWAPQDSWPYFTVSVLRLPQPGGPGPRIYISQEQGGPVIHPGTGFPFHHLLWLAGLRWRYSTPPPQFGWCPHCITTWHEPHIKQHLQQFVFFCAWTHFSGNLFVFQSLPSNGSTRYNIIILYLIILSVLCKEYKLCIS